MLSPHRAPSIGGIAAPSRLAAVFGIDLRTLALFRILTAALVIADLIGRARDLTAHYSDAGVLPRAALRQLAGGWPPSLHLASGSAGFQAVLMGLAGLVALSLLVGYRTRVATIVSWLLLVSLQARNPALIHGGDNLLALLLFWGLFLPLGARCSVDGALDATMARAPDAFFSAATVALLVQAMSVYLFSALLKSAPQWWPDGTAVEQALQLDHLATPLAVWLRQFPALLHGLTYFVFSLELVGPVLMFLPAPFPWVRLAVQALFVSMHIGFALCLEIGLFPFISIAALSAFTPAWVWDRLAAWLRTRRRSGLVIHYDADCAFCLKTCLILRSLLVLGTVPVLKAQDDAAIHQQLLAYNSWVVVDPSGGRHVRWAGVALVFRSSPLFGWVGALFATRACAGGGERIYRFVADHRAAFARVSAVLMPYRDGGLRHLGAIEVVVAVLAVAVLWANIASLPFAAVRLPSTVDSLTRLLILGQRWNMFAPAPASHEGWFVARGTTGGAQAVDVLQRTAGEPSFERPTELTGRFSSYRWRKYLMRLAFELEPAHRTLYARYLCRSGGGDTPARLRFDRVELFFMHDHIERDGWRRTTRRVLLAEQACTDDPSP